MVNRGIIEAVMATFDFDSVVDLEYIQSLTTTVNGLVITGLHLFTDFILNVRFAAAFR